MVSEKEVKELYQKAYVKSIKQSVEHKKKIEVNKMGEFYSITIISSLPLNDQELLELMKYGLEGITPSKLEDELAIEYYFMISEVRYYSILSFVEKEQ